MRTPLFADLTGLPLDLGQVVKYGPRFEQRGIIVGLRANLRRRYNYSTKSIEEKKLYTIVVRPVISGDTRIKTPVRITRCLLEG